MQLHQLICLLVLVPSFSKHLLPPAPWARFGSTQRLSTVVSGARSRVAATAGARGALLPCVPSVLLQGNKSFALRVKIRLKNFPDVGPIYSVSLKVPESEVCAGLAARSCFLICALQRKQVGLKLSKDTKAVLYKVTCKAKMKKKKKKKVHYAFGNQFSALFSDGFIKDISRGFGGEL